MPNFPLSAILPTSCGRRRPHILHIGVNALNLYLLASGSKGNSTYVEAGDTRVIIDHGLSTARLCRRLAALDVPPESIDAIVLTHEHADHVRGLRVWRKKYGPPLFANPGSLSAIPESSRAGGPISCFKTGVPFEIGPLRILPFPLPHDAMDPVGLVLEYRGRRVAMATDLGRATELIRNRMEKADAVVIESNHDPDMLINGPYPWHVKERIRRNHGHLSNRQMAELLSDINHAGLKAVALAHLSETNNTPALALACARRALNGRASPKIILAGQAGIAQPIILK